MSQFDPVTEVASAVQSVLEEVYFDSEVPERIKGAYRFIARAAICASLCGRARDEWDAAVEVLEQNGMERTAKAFEAIVAVCDE